MQIILRNIILELSCNVIKSGSRRFFCTQNKTATLGGHSEPKFKTPQPNDSILIAGHVGTGFCLAAAISNKGQIINEIGLPIKIYEKGVFGEMSSETVWKTLIKCIKKVTANIDISMIEGMGFSGTSALVCLDDKANPITASISRDPNRNIIINSDNRSMLEAKKINKTRHQVLQYLGEQILPDFQDSRLMWIKNNLNEECWKKAGHFLNLTDFLSWKATGSFIRSSSALSINSSYTIAVNGKEGWNASFFYEIDIPEVIENNFRKLGAEVQRPGIPLPNGLLKDVAKEMGLKPNLPVSTGMPDTLAGCLGLVGCNNNDIAKDIVNRYCILSGKGATSELIMSREPRFVKGLKGPLLHSVLPDMWLNQADKATAENVLNFIIDGHPATSEIKKQIGPMNIHKYLNKIIKIKAEKYKLKARDFLTKYLHTVSDYDGNKSPYMDPWIRGMIAGLSATSGQESLAYLYLATMQSLAYSTRNVINTLSENGHDIRCIFIGGHLGRNSLFAQTHKNICQLPILIPDEFRSKLLGAAILAGVAANVFRDLNHAMEEMCGKGNVILPQDDLEIIDFHERKFRVFLKMYDHQREYRRIMSSESDESQKGNESKINST